MKKMIAAVIMFLSIGILQAQQAVVTIEEEFDVLTERWRMIVGQLETYDGLGAFCQSPDFRRESVMVLSTIHHLDSLILDMMLDPTSGLEVSKHDFRKTLKDIYKFEEEYGVRSFIGFLKESCITRNDLEANVESLRNESGMYSYDGQIMMLETRLSKYLKHMTKVETIDEHIHHIHPDHLYDIQILAQNETD